MSLRSITPPTLRIKRYKIAPEKNGMDNAAVIDNPLRRKGGKRPAAASKRVVDAVGGHLFPRIPPGHHMGSMQEYHLWEISATVDAKFDLG